jgi:hypothetical protein
MVSMQPMRGSNPERWLEQVREGMKVVDASGEDIGRVDYVQMGDPEAVTTRGEGFTMRGAIVAGPGSATGAPAASGSGPVIAAPIWPIDDATGPDVPEPLRARLIREGYFRVDGPFLFGKDRYVQADMIAGVRGDTVMLRVNKDALPVKGEGFET